MSRVCIVEAQAATALGPDLDATWAAVLAGSSGIGRVERFPTANCVSDKAALMVDLAADGSTSLFTALVTRLLERTGPIPADAALITATTKAGIDELEKSMRGGQTEGRGLPGAFLPEFVSEKLGLEDTGMNVSAACASSTIALARGAALIKSARFDVVLVVCADVITEFVFSGFSALRALSPEPCRPFDAARDGLSLGDGAAALLLMSEERAEKEGHEVLAYLAGWGSANDATHVTAPARDGCGLIEATGLALEMAVATPGDIGGICAHGTGTVFNDAMELTAFSHVFGDHRPPLFSVKGALGHTMGAAGGIETALAVKMLTTGKLPPNAGLVTPEQRAQGWVHGETLEVDAKRILTTNSGFGGINCALVVEGAGDR